MPSRNKDDFLHAKVIFIRSSSEGQKRHVRVAISQKVSVRIL